MGNSFFNTVVAVAAIYFTAGAAAGAVGAAEAGGAAAGEGLLAGEVLGGTATGADIVGSALADDVAMGELAVAPATETAATGMGATAANGGTATLAADAGAKTLAEKALVGGELAGSGSLPGYEESLAAQDAASGSNLWGSGAKTVEPSGGLISDAMGWAKQNPLPAIMLGQTAAGLAQGVGGALLGGSAAEKKAEADSRLLSQQTRERLNLQAATTAQTAANSFKGKLPFAPNTPPQNVLYRADGTPVYLSGSGRVNNV